MSILPAPGTPGFPQCAYNCVPFTGATASCLPPAAPQTNQRIYDQCFCQSSILQIFYTTPNGLCDAFCTNPTDLQQLQSWYRQFCAQVQAGAAPGGSTSSTLTTSTTKAANAPTTAPQTTGSINDNSPSTSSSSSNKPPKGWFDAHWRWVVMLVVLFPSLILLAVLGLWLRRRHRRKLAARRAAASGFHPPPVSESTRSVTTRSLPGQEMWGPHQHMAHTRGWEYGDEQDADYVRNGGGPRPFGQEIVAAGLGRYGSTRKSRKRKEDKGKERAENPEEMDAKRGGQGVSGDDTESGKKRHHKHRRHHKRPRGAQGAHQGNDASGEPMSEKAKERLTPIPSRDGHRDAVNDDDGIGEAR